MEEMLMGANPNHNASSNPPPQPPPPPSAAGTQRAAAPPAAGSAGAGAGGGAGAGASTERRARPQKEKALNCPRCNSTNTKPLVSSATMHIDLQSAVSSVEYNASQFMFRELSEGPGAFEKENHQQIVSANNM
ncbi:hypothetical protein ABZP36_022463 [Zizania latifolia]